MDAPNARPASASEIGSPVGMRIYRYRAIVRRYWWVLLLCVSVGLLYEVFVLVTKPTRFVSLGKLIVSESNPDESSQARKMEMGWGGTIVETLKSPVIRERAGQKVAVEKPQSVHLVEGVEVTAINEPNTFFFTVTGAGPDPAVHPLFCGCDDGCVHAVAPGGKPCDDERPNRPASQAGRDGEGRSGGRAAACWSNSRTRTACLSWSSRPSKSRRISPNLRRARSELMQQVNIYKNLNEASLLEANSPKNEKEGQSASLAIRLAIAGSTSRSNSRSRRPNSRSEASSGSPRIRVFSSLKRKFPICG